ncbi:MAG: hypothetical protein HUU15_04550 [Candidatus Brocadiae bacterium]|nr:hypothetical protein [Candidatus Brocadiia bacterium]
MEESLQDNVEAQQRALAGLEGKSTILRLISAVGSYSLGVIPLRRGEDGLVLATFPGICPAALAVVRRRLQMPLCPVAFDENVMMFFIDKLYLKGRGVNIHTFPREDFLEDEANDERVLSLKEEKPEGTGSALAADEIVLADLRLRSELRNLDRPAPPALDAWRLGEFCPAWRGDGDRFRVWSEQPLPKEIPLLLQYSEDYHGDEYYRDLTAVAVGEWPQVLFPSEVQILGIREDGALDLYLDGATHRIPPGSNPVLRTSYCLVRHGYRFRRSIEVRVREIARVRRDALAFDPPFRGAGAPELRKWLGLETD